ncbi:hypothetical protein C8Q76DRAFT_692058 [Earliella scabrosa]|nr:hypothetical protein C8Q76DRAFT_692058 [Earliella scabrosa]
MAIWAIGMEPEHGDSMHVSVGDRSVQLTRANHRLESLLQFSRQEGSSAKSVSDQPESRTHEHDTQVHLAQELAPVFDSDAAFVFTAQSISMSSTSSPVTANNPSLPGEAAPVKHRHETKSHGSNHVEKSATPTDQPPKATPGASSGANKRFKNTQLPAPLKMSGHPLTRPHLIIKCGYPVPEVH